ncbi:MAG: hypothetical protein WD845_01750 [Pirellulales bacterium]
MCTQIRSLATAAVVFLSCSNCAWATAETAAVQASSALESLDAWLSGGPTAKGWDEFLRLDALRAELPKGNDADPAIIDVVVTRLDSAAPGLELPKFRELRAALGIWSEELAIAKAGSLSKAALAAESKYVPLAAAEAAATKAQLAEAAAKLDKYLAGDNGKAWRDFLRWDELQQQLAAENPDLDVLASVYQKFTEDHEGLDMPVFANVATELDKYISVVAANREDVQQQYAAQLKGLADELDKYSAEQSEELASAIGTRLGWLQRMRQAGGLVRAVREKHSQPNLFVEASARLVGAGIEQDVDDVAPVRDYILGTDISGTGHTKGRVTVQLVPSETNAMLDIMLAGTTATRTTGYNGPATIYTNGNVAIAGRKRVIIDESGFKTYRATGAANTRTTITGIGGGKLVQRIASRKVSEQKGEAERIASDHAAVRVRNRLEGQSSGQLGKAHQDFEKKFRKPLLRRREFPELFKFRTTEDALFVTGMKANRMQLGAPGAPPQVDGQYDLVLRVHETMINNMAAALLAGVTLHEAEVQQKVIDLQGELPEKLKSDENQDPWSITFAASRPVTIRFADDGFKVTIRGQRYTSGERNFRAMNVTASYQAQIDGNGAKMVRQGELEILPPNFVPGKSRLSTQQVSLKTLLEKRFGKLFEPEMKSAGLELPGNWKNAGRLDLKVLQSNGGWLALAWLESGEPVKDKEEDRVALDKSGTK